MGGDIALRDFPKTQCNGYGPLKVAIFSGTFPVETMSKFSWNINKSTLQESFCVNFKLILCQSYINFMQTASSLPNIHLGQKGLKLCHAVEGLFQYNTNSWTVNHAPLMYFPLPHKSG